MPDPEDEAQAPTQDDHAGAIMDAVNRAHGSGALTADHVLDIRRALADAHDTVEPELSDPAFLGLHQMVVDRENPGPRPANHMWDYGEQPATPAQRQEMLDEARFLVNREPTGSEAAAIYADIAKQLSGRSPVMVPAPRQPEAEEEHQPSEGLFLRELPGGGVEFKPWAAIKGFMGSEPGSAENIRRAADIAMAVAGSSNVAARGALGRSSVPAGTEVGAAARRAGEAASPALKGYVEEGGFTTGFAGKAPAIVAEVEAQLQRSLPDEVSFRVVSEIKRVMGGQLYDIRGEYDPVHRLIQVATEGTDPMAVARHETIHALRSIGLYSDKEWSTLVDHAKKIGIDDQFDIDDYRHLYRNARDLEERLDQERVAHMAEAWKGGTRYGKTIDDLLARIYAVIEAMKNALRGHGFNTPDSIFNKTFGTGEIGRRGK